MEQLKVTKNLKKREQGITLISLVVTIIVLLILSAIALSMLTGENSVLKRATGAKEATERAEIEEALKLAYIDLVGQDVLNQGSAAGLNKAVEQVNREYGNVIESKGAGGPAITGVKLSNSDIIIGTTASSNSTTVTVEVLTGESNGTSNSYYAKINGQYYKVNDDCSIVKTATEFNTSGDTSNPTITVATGDSTIATASISNKVITIKGADTPKEGNTNLTVTVNGTTYSDNWKITAKGLATLANSGEFSNLDKTNNEYILELDGAYMLIPKISSGDASDLMWESQNPDIATVTSEGVVKCANRVSNGENDVATILCKGANTTIECKVHSTAKKATSKGTGAPTVPTGFTAIDTADAKWSNATAETDKGLVIMDEKGNEFVWVPVPNAIHDGTTPLPETATTVTSSLYTPMATTYEYNGNTYYRGMLYTHSSATVDGNTVTQVLYNSTWVPGSTNNREPSLVTNNSNDKWAPMTSVSGTSTSYDVGHFADAGSFSTVMEFGAKMQSDYDKMVQSVNTKGGFYIGRYESSLVNGKTRVVAGATSMNASTSSANMWYGLYKKQESFATDNELTSVESDMVWGSQYDAMMNWIAKNGVNVTTASGSRADNKTKNTTRVTGKATSAINDKINNVYDILGNSREWTAEAISTSLRVCRGGTYSNDYSPSYRIYYNPSNTNAYNGSRPTLYVQ